jgi:hypothetical protein
MRADPKTRSKEFYFEAKYSEGEAQSKCDIYIVSMKRSSLVKDLSKARFQGLKIGCEISNRVTESLEMVSIKLETCQ